MATETAKTTVRRGAAIAAWLRIRRGEISVAFLFVLFVVLAFFIKSPGFREEDADITQFIQRADTPLLTTLCEGLTALGSGVGLAILSLPFVAWLWQSRRPGAVWLLPLTISGHLFNVLIKAAFNRPRPGVGDDILVLLAAQGSSFPSGHAQAATMFFGFLAVLIAIHVQSRSVRHTLIAVSVGIGLAICFSRIYLGAHFLSDVIGGIAAGLIFLWGWIQFYRRFAPQEFSPSVLNNPVSGDK